MLVELGQTLALGTFDYFETVEALVYHCKDASLAEPMLLTTKRLKDVSPDHLTTDAAKGGLRLPLGVDRQLDDYFGVLYRLWDLSWLLGPACAKGLAMAMETETTIDVLVSVEIRG